MADKKKEPRTNLEGAGQEVVLSRYTVLKFMTRRAEGMKPYEVGSEIKLSDEDAAPLIEHGFIKPKQTRGKKK